MVILTPRRRLPESLILESFRSSQAHRKVSNRALQEATYLFDGVYLGPDGRIFE